MSDKKPFEYLAYAKETVVAQGLVFATDATKAKNKVIFQLGTEKSELDLDEAEVLVRPFVGS